MHKYTIHYESGWMSHCGSIDISGSGVVELTDEQVTALRNLARESGTKDVEQAYGIEITDTFLPEGYQVQIPEEICQELTDL